MCFICVVFPPRKRFALRLQFACEKKPVIYEVVDLFIVKKIEGKIEKYHIVVDTYSKSIEENEPNVLPLLAIPELALFFALHYIL
jgi:hypothetical protein